jgi:hypothetical protein
LPPPAGEGGDVVADAPAAVGHLVDEDRGAGAGPRLDPGCGGGSGAGRGGRRGGGTAERGRRSGVGGGAAGAGRGRRRGGAETRRGRLVDMVMRKGGATVRSG